jgi:hypothetical protein
MSPGPNYRRRSTYEPAQPAELPPRARFAPKMPPNSRERANGLICVGSAFFIWNQPQLSTLHQTPDHPPGAFQFLICGHVTHSGLTALSQKLLDHPGIVEREVIGHTCNWQGVEGHLSHPESPNHISPISLGRKTGRNQQKQSFPASKLRSSGPRVCVYRYASAEDQRNAHEEGDCDL